METQAKTVIRYYVKDVYGKELRYPVDYAEQISRLTMCRTLRDQDMQALKEMGFEFRQIIRP